MVTDFRLGAFTFTLLYDHIERKGIQFAIKEFTIEFKKYDKNNPNCPLDYKLKAVNQDFGIYSVSNDNEPVALYEKIEEEQSQEELKVSELGDISSNENFMSKTTIAKHNILY